MDNMKIKAMAVILAAVILNGGSQAAEEPKAWQVGTPIVTYWCGPSLTDAVAQQMAEGGYNLVWCTEKELDVAQRHGLRAQLTDGLLSPATLDNPEQRAKLDALIERVRQHPALYAYHIMDEPSTAQFPALSQIVEYLRQRDPAHLAYINLFPTYANNEQLGTKGDVVTAYREHLNQYVSVVKPGLISYDHYQFMKTGDMEQYFLNLSMIQKTAQEAKLPFLNIVQAASWNPGVRVPNVDEMRYLVYTTAAYGAQGISYYIYCCPNHEGGIANADGTPTPLYDALKSYNREFVAIAKELQTIPLLAAYHTAMKEAGCVALPADAAFSLKDVVPDGPRGFLLGFFGAKEQATHVVVVNLDYTAEAAVTLVGPEKLEVFDAFKSEWTAVKKPQADLTFPPGGGKLVRVRK
jgi:hypothetical protein